MRGGASLTGGGAFVAAGFLVLGALLVVLASWQAYRADQLRAAAALAAGPENAIRILDVAVRVRPNDPDLWDDLASAHLRAAGDPPRGDDPGGHVAAALKAARAGRAAQPLVPGPHLRLGAFADRFARSEPAAAHFARAKKVGFAEPDVWYVSGKEAAGRGDWAAALADWRESLARAPRRLPQIARAAAGRVPPDEFRAKALPDDPAQWYAVTPILFPDAADPERAKWLRAIADRGARGEPETAAGFIGWASALEGLNETAEAVRVWRRATERFPDDVPLRDRFAARLEAEELYEEAVPVLEWLSARRPDVSGYANRLAAARHALKLKADINRP